jgi:hypothetical protein
MYLLLGGGKRREYLYLLIMNGYGNWIGMDWNGMEMEWNRHTVALADGGRRSEISYI